MPKSILINKFEMSTEYNPLEPPKLNEKVLKDKRKKLKETFDRVIHMYVSMHQSILFTNEY